MAGALTDPAVGVDDILIAQSEVVNVDLAQFISRFERAVIIGRGCPRDGVGGGNMPSAQSALFRVVRHVGALTGVFLRAAHVDQRDLADGFQHLGQECADGRVVAFDNRVVGAFALRLFAGHFATFGFPLGAAAVHEPNIFVAEQLEHPHGVCGPPVGLVSVDDDRVVTADALGAHHFGECGALNVVADHLVVQFGVPVDFDRTGDVSGFVEQDVFVRFNDDDTGSVEVLSHPRGGDESFRVGVVGELRIGCVG